MTAYPNVQRQVREAYPKPSNELVMLVVNLWYYKKLAVRRTRRYYSHEPTSHTKVLKALSVALQMHRELRSVKNAGQSCSTIMDLQERLRLGVVLLPNIR